MFGAEVDGTHGGLYDGGVDAGLDLLGNANGDALHPPGDGSCPLLEFGAVLSVDHGNNKFRNCDSRWMAAK